MKIRMMSETLSKSCDCMHEAYIPIRKAMTRNKIELLLQKMISGKLIFGNETRQAVVKITINVATNSTLML